MKRRIVLGLALIFIVAAVCGVLVSRTTNRLSTVNQARILTGELNRLVGRLDVVTLQTREDAEEASLGQSLRRIHSGISQMDVLMDDLGERILIEDIGQGICGPCHQEPDPLVAGLQEIFRGMQDSFAELSGRVSTLAGGAAPGGQAPTGAVDPGLEVYQDRLVDLRSAMAPMLGHMDTEVSNAIARIDRSQDMTMVLSALLILAVMVAVAAAVIRPLNELVKGTETIARGDYDLRLEAEGKDETALLAGRFRSMAEVLASREDTLRRQRQEMDELNRTLEEKVEERTRAFEEKQDELKRKYVELESANREMKRSYAQLQTTTAELESAQAKLQENYNILKMMNKEFQRANEVKNKFLSIMSHELRTPLTVINGYLSLVLEKDYGRPSSELRDLLKIVKEQGHNQLGLIEDLLDLTRIEAGEFRLQRLSFHVPDLISKAVENFRPRFVEKGIRIHVKAGGALPTVHWDFQKILQVFQNLLDNAVKFTPEGGEIEIDALSKSDFMELRIRDNGIGIPADNLERIFDRFYQVDSSPTRPYGGSGLGLSIVREIILAHRGKIFVESEEGRGTCFLILLPIGEPHRVTKKIREDSATVHEPRGESGGKGEMILVVDDDEAFLRMMTMILPKEGYRVFTTGQSARVVDLAKEQSADLVMLDLMMPAVDGFEVCRRLRRDPVVGDVPILVVSAAGSEDVGRRVFEAGADEHVAKPFDQRDLLHHIASLLKRRINREEERSGDSESSKPQGP